MTTEPNAIERVRHALASKDASALKNLAGQIAGYALEQDEGVLTDLIVLCYTAAKFFDKHYILHSPEWKAFYQHTLDALAQAQALHQTGREAEARERVRAILDEAEGLSKAFGKFIVNSVEKARIKTATQLYAHGASLGRAAGLARANPREVSAYIGVTHLSERYKTLGVRERIDRLEQILAGGDAK